MHTGRLMEGDSTSSPQRWQYFATAFTFVSVVFLIAVLLRPAFMARWEGTAPAALSQSGSLGAREASPIPCAVLPVLGIGAGLTGIVLARRVRNRRAGAERS